MELKDIIFVPSVQHTGTWFTIKFLQNFIPNTKEIAHMLQDRKQVDQPTILHSHFPILHDLEMNVDMDWHSRRKLTMKNRFISLRAINIMCNLFRVIIPVRDPLAAILSREARHPDLRHFFIVDGFIEIAQLFVWHPNVKFLPIDLPWTVEQRKDKLLEIMEHCSIDPTLYGELLDKISVEWEPQNITPGNKYKELYKNKDIDQIKFLLGPKWAEIEYLKNMAAIIHPFLVQVGYTKGDLDLW